MSECAFALFLLIAFLFLYNIMIEQNACRCREGAKRGVMMKEVISQKASLLLIEASESEGPVSTVKHLGTKRGPPHSLRLSFSQRCLLAFCFSSLPSGF